MKQEYLSSVDEVVRAQNTTVNGLTSAEAEKRLASVGKNKLAEGKKDSLFQRFMKELSDPMIIILIVAVIRQIKCCLIPQIKNDFLRYAEALRSELFAAISAHCFM